MGGDAGGSEAAFSSMASDRASGIRRRHSTKVVARLSFGRAAPTRAQLIPFVSRCYGSIAGWAMRDDSMSGGGQNVESSHLCLGLMAQGKKGDDAACYDRREAGPRSQILSEAAPIRTDEERSVEMAPPREATRQRRRSPAVRTD